MYVLMEHRSPERRPTKSALPFVERHRQPLLRGRAVVHSSHPSSPHPSALRYRYSITPSVNGPASAQLTGKRKESGTDEISRRKTSEVKGQQQLRRRQFVRQNEIVATDSDENNVERTINTKPTAEDIHDQQNASRPSRNMPSDLACPSRIRQIQPPPPPPNITRISEQNAPSKLLRTSEGVRVDVVGDIERRRAPMFQPQLRPAPRQGIKYASSKVRPVNKTVQVNRDDADGEERFGDDQHDGARERKRVVEEKENTARKRTTHRTTPTTTRKELRLAFRGGEEESEVLKRDRHQQQQNNSIRNNNNNIYAQIAGHNTNSSNNSDKMNLRAITKSEWSPGGEQPQKRRFTLSRSKSQSRNNLLLTQHKASLEQFQMGRSKTATNLAFVANECSTIGDHFSLSRRGPLGLLRRGANLRKLSLQRCRPAFSGAQSAVIELFDAEESDQRRGERERAEMLSVCQFEWVQKELKAFAERRHLALGRRRKVRIADLGADQLHAQLAARQAKAVQGQSSNNYGGRLFQRPRKKPLHEYYNDDDAELEALANTVDPSAPQPNGQLIVPARGDFPAASTSGAPPPPLPRSIDSVLYKWANTQPKSVAAVQLDSGGKAVGSLTYGKLLSRANKVAYHLLTRQVTVNSGGVKERVHLCLPDDRVALVFPNSEPLAFLVAFYGCLLAGVVPVPIEVPMPKRDVAGLQQFGFFLGSCGAHVALTSESCMKVLPKAGSVSSSAPSGANPHFASSSSGAGMLLHSPSSTFAPSGAFPSSTTGSTGSGSSSGAQRDHNPFIHHSPPLNPNDVADFKGWPRLHWVVTEHLGKPSKDWTLPSLVADDHSAYIEYTFDREGSIKGVEWSRQAMLSHSRTIGAAAGFKEDETMVCVVDFKRDVGLWFAMIAAILHGMRVHFVPYSLMKVNPTAWLSQVTRHCAQHAVAKSRDLHWSLMAVGDHSQIQLKSLRCLLVADGANPWSLSSCDQFISTFKSHGIWPGALCPCAGSAETGIVAMRRPSHPEQQNVARNGGTSTNCSTSGRGVLSMLALSHCVVRVDQENSLTSLTLQDTGQVIPGGMAVVVKLSGPPKLCRADEVGEICLHSPSTANCYHGLKGLSQNVFAMLPLGHDDKPIGPLEYVRSGLAGFLGPEGLIFTVGCKQSLLHVSGRVHSADDLIATVLAVEPMKFVYRGRIAVFSVSVLRDERVCIVCEQRAELSEDDAFNWMVRVVQACDSIHQLGIYCLVLVPPNHLPKTSLGGIYVTETRRRFLDGCLHPSTLLMCPQNCVLNLPKPREPPAEVGPAAMFVGNIVQGVRIAGAQGKELPMLANECVSLAEILRYRAQHSPEHVLYSLLNSRGVETDALTSSQLLKRAERIAALLTEKGRLSPGDHVALIFPPGLDLVSAVFGCFFASLVPICIRPPSVHNFHNSMLTVRMIIDVSKAVALISNGALIKLLRSKELSHRVNAKAWPTILDVEDAPSLSVARSKMRKSGGGVAEPPPRQPDDICYLDFAVSTTGQLSGIAVTALGVATQCKSLKMACELYPSRSVTVCLDPYSGLGFTLWCLCSVYSGHQSVLIPPLELEQNPLVWLQTLNQNRSRDTFCTYSVMELCLKELAVQVGQLKEKGMNLSSLRNCVVVAEERPRVQLCNAFIKVFGPLGLSPRAGAVSPDPTTVFVDARALRNDRVTLVEKGAPHSIALMESGKLLPGVKVVIANPKTLGQCADTHLGEIWVASGHSASGFFSLFGEEAHLQTNHFNARLKTGDTNTKFARTGYLGFLRQTQAITADGELHDAVFVVGALEEALMLRGMRFHPVDIELSVARAHRRIDESCVFTWTHLLVVVAETHAPEAEALDLVPAITSALLEDHHLIVGVVVVLDPGTIPINSRGEKQRMHLRELFLKDQLDPIYVAYNM
uniref:AMP-dependent synthetase/ligase domain-containing protein n=1 Tax=Globodera rostochiensis TaxID=31243 RepID=A0A914GXB6_GLORO